MKYLFILFFLIHSSVSGMLQDANPEKNDSFFKKIRGPLLCGMCGIAVAGGVFIGKTLLETKISDAERNLSFLCNLISKEVILKRWQPIVGVALFNLFYSERQRRWQEIENSDKKLIILYGYRLSMKQNTISYYNKNCSRLREFIDLKINFTNLTESIIIAQNKEKFNEDFYRNKLLLKDLEKEKDYYIQEIKETEKKLNMDYNKKNINMCIDLLKVLLFRILIPQLLFIKVLIIISIIKKNDWFEKYLNILINKKIIFLNESNKLILGWLIIREILLCESINCLLYNMIILSIYFYVNDFIEYKKNLLESSREKSLKMIHEEGFGGIYKNWITNLDYELNDIKKYLNFLDQFGTKYVEINSLREKLNIDENNIYFEQEIFDIAKNLIDQSSFISYSEKESYFNMIMKMYRACKENHLCKDNQDLNLKLLNSLFYFILNNKKWKKSFKMLTTKLKEIEECDPKHFESEWWKLIKCKSIAGINLSDYGKYRNFSFQAQVMEEKKLFQEDFHQLVSQKNEGALLYLLFLYLNTNVIPMLGLRQFNALAGLKVYQRQQHSNDGDEREEEDNFRMLQSQVKIFIKILNFLVKNN